MGDIAMSARSHQEPLSAWKDQVCSPDGTSKLAAQHHMRWRHAGLRSSWYKGGTHAHRWCPIICLPCMGPIYWARTCAFQQQRPTLQVIFSYQFM